MNDNLKNLLDNVQDRLNAVPLEKRKKALIAFAMFFMIVFAVRIVSAIPDKDEEKVKKENVGDTARFELRLLDKELTEQDSAKIRLLEFEIKSSLEEDEEFQKTIERMKDKIKERQ